MGWIVVPNLLEGRDQLNRRFPNRDKGAEGTIGDTDHKASPSSHNPDRTGSPEFRDGDSLDEVRAADFDKDLNHPGVTMEQVVQLWVKLARAGVLWWVRYIIFNGRIWHRHEGFATRVYTGSNNHADHVHVNSDYTQAADEVRGTNWRLYELGTQPSTPAPAPQPSGRPAPGPAVAFPLPQGYYFGPHDGPYNSISGWYGERYSGRLATEWLQMWANQLARRGWLVGKGQRWLGQFGNDGKYGSEYDALARAFQQDQHLAVDGEIGPKTWWAAYHNRIN